jgi:hypothetical protein
MVHLDLALIEVTRKSAHEDNKLRVEDHAAHDWYQFVLSLRKPGSQCVEDGIRLKSRNNMSMQFIPSEENALGGQVNSA